VEVAPPNNPLQSAENVLGPLATAAIVIVFTIFILMGREDLRNRFIRLIGGGHLTLRPKRWTTQPTASTDILLLQLIVNACYGLVIGIALHFIRIPNASLWGVSAGILCFLPYVGPPMAALMPLCCRWQFSLAGFTRWRLSVSSCFGIESSTLGRAASLWDSCRPLASRRRGGSRL